MTPAQQKADAPRRIVLVTNMYPDAVDPSKGTFVRSIFESVKSAFPDTQLVALANSTGTLAKLGAYWRFYRDTFRSLRRDRDALFYVHYVLHSAPPFRLAALLGMKRTIVAHTHGSDVRFEGNPGPLVRAIKRALSRGLLQQSQLIIAPSSYFRDTIVSEFGMPADRIAVSPSGGVDMQIFHPGPDRPTATGTVHIGFVGRLTRDKGIHDFLGLADRLRSEGVDTRASVAGKGPEEAVVAAHESVEHHRFLAHPELAALYRDLDLFVFPTYRDSESLGLVGVEAMACGVPVVAYRGAGPETYVEDGVNGFLVDRGDTEALARVVAQYATWTTEKRAQMRKKAVETAQGFDVGRVMTKLNETLAAVPQAPI